VRVTVDTNIWVSAVISSHGAPARLERAFRTGRFTLVTSEPLLDETEGVLLRPRLVRRYGVTSERVSELLQLQRDHADIVEITGMLSVCRDPDDDVVIETAINGKADVLISGDSDLLDDSAALHVLHEHGIEVWTVRQFVEWLEKNDFDTRR
jgi:putative PIN family toxin of toxin-antitoxin system